ncbi:hypothetical protein EE612_014924 [Oryza sativa]|nr:hypothetical protein EE612_014924 [Oryza sativa]
MKTLVFPSSDLKSCGWISQGGRSLRCQTSISSALATPDCGKFSYSAGGRKSSSFEVAGHSLRWIWMASTDFRDPFVHLILGAVPFLSDALSRVVSGEGGLTHAQIVVIFGGLGGAELAELLEQFVLADSSHASIPNIVSTDSTSINLLLCLNQLSKQQHKSWASKEHAMNPLHHTGNQQATQQGKAGPGKGNEVSFSILTHGIHLKFVRLYHRHHLASLKLKVSWVLDASSISFLCSSIHVEVIVRVEHRLSVRLWSAGMLLVFLRFDDDFHGNHWLSPVKPPTYLRLNSKAQLVPNPWRQPEGSPTGQMGSTFEEALGCNRRGNAADLRRLYSLLLLYQMIWKFASIIQSLPSFRKMVLNICCCQFLVR